MTKIKLTTQELSKMVQRNIKKVLKEDYTDRGNEEYRKSPFPEDIEYDSDSYEGEIENVSVDKVLESYLTALLWSAGEELDEYSIQDIDDNSVRKSKDDILRFIKLVENNPEAIEEMNSYDEEEFGHNLALSRNGHGAGFFDNNNDVLQDLARNFGQADLYAGDDGNLHVAGAEGGFNESKQPRTIKVKISELREIIKQVVNEDYNK